MATYYLDYVNGSDANNGSSWALAWKTLTLGATAAAIAPGDTIKIAKSPAPTALAGTTATWNNLSKTVTLASAETATVDLCEVAWTAGAGSDCTVARTGVATDGKQGSYCMKLTLDAAVQTSKLQAYKATGTLDLSGYQKLSFWIKNNGAIVANNWYVALCSDTAGATVVDTFPIPAIPSVDYWLPLTITKSGGGNLGSSIQSIAIYSGTSNTGMASKYIYVDDFIACTTNGLNLQSLISKNSAEQGGTESWYGIQSISGTTVLLDNGVNAKGNTGRGYAGATESVNTYIRETIKTSMATATTTKVQEIMDSGTYGSNIEFQGGYDTSTGNQTGETFFDGLNGLGYGIYNAKSFTVINRLNACRYNFGLYYSSANNSDIGATICCNNSSSGAALNAYNSSITSMMVNNNTLNGVDMELSNKKVEYVLADNNLGAGLYMSSAFNNYVVSATCNNNATYGVNIATNSNNRFGTLTTSGNTTAGISMTTTTVVIDNATISDTTKIASLVAFANAKVFINKLGSYAAIYTDSGNITSRASTLTNGSGIEWLFTTDTNTNRQLNYPLKLTIAKIAVVASKLVTVTCYFKKGHATNIGAKLVSPAQLGAVYDDDTCPSDTNENQLTVTFTPTVAGVAEIEAWAYYIAGHSTVIVDAITITQAD